MLKCSSVDVFQASTISRMRVKADANAAAFSKTSEAVTSEPNPNARLLEILKTKPDEVEKKVPERPEEREKKEEGQEKEEEGEKREDVKELEDWLDDFLGE